MNFIPKVHAIRFGDVLVSPSYRLNGSVTEKSRTDIISAIIRHYKKTNSCTVIRNLAATIV